MNLMKNLLLCKQQLTPL